MPELPDITLYVEALRARILGHSLRKVRLNTPFLLRTAEPPLAETFGRTIQEVDRLGKRIVLHLEDEYSLVVHLMIAGRLHWKKPGATIGGKVNLAAFDFDSGSLTLTEAGTKKRASLHVVKGPGRLETFRREGLEVMESTHEQFGEALRRENHTVKRALTDPDLFSGIGNAYSDEILHRARLSPLILTSRLSDEQIGALHRATLDTLAEWVRRLREEAGERFPEGVTAFRPDFAVHGRYNQPCPVCGAPVRRIRYADNETNYCATCQTGGKVLADRAMSRLLK